MKNPKGYTIPYDWQWGEDLVEDNTDNAEFVFYKDHLQIHKIATDLLEAMRTGVQLSFKELDRMEEVLNG